MNDEGEAVVCDYGLFIVIDLLGPSFVTSTFTGSLRCMAPELVLASTLDDAPTRSMRTDVYSFGCVAYEVRFISYITLLQISHR